MASTSHRVTAAELQRGESFTAAERRAQRDILTGEQWRKRISFAVWRCFKSDDWSQADRDDAAAELWLAAFASLRDSEPDSYRHGPRVTPREAATLAVSWRIDSDGNVKNYNGPTAAAPHSDDPRHSAAAYHGLAGNIRARMLRRKERVQSVPVGEDQSAIDFTADERDDSAAPLPAEVRGIDAYSAAAAAERRRRTLPDAAVRGDDLAAARAQRDAYCKRIGLDLPTLGYLAARSPENNAELAEVRAEVGATPDVFRKRLQAERRSIAAELESAADAVLYLTACQPRTGHLGAEHIDASGQRTYWHENTLMMRPSGKRKRVATPVLTYCRQDNSRAVYPRKGVRGDDGGAAKDRKGRSMSKAGEAARRHTLAALAPAAVQERTTEPTAERTYTRAERIDTLARRGRPKPSPRVEGESVEAWRKRRNTEALIAYRQAREGRRAPRAAQPTPRTGKAVGTRTPRLEAAPPPSKPEPKIAAPTLTEHRATNAERERRKLAARDRSVQGMLWATINRRVLTARVA